MVLDTKREKNVSSDNKMVANHQCISIIHKGNFTKKIGVYKQVLIDIQVLKHNAIVLLGVEVVADEATITHCVFCYQCSSCSVLPASTGTRMQHHSKIYRNFCNK